MRQKHYRAKEDVNAFDITGKVAPLFERARGSHEEESERWGMYSYDRPAYLLWNAIGKELYRQGWEMDEIRCLLESKIPRWALDGELGDALETLGAQYAKDRFVKERVLVQSWLVQKAR